MPLQDSLAAACGELMVQGGVLRVGEQDVTVGQGHDRGPVGEIVGLEHLGRLGQHGHAEGRKDDEADDDLDGYGP
jgi:hypothetical protein